MMGAVNFSIDIGLISAMKQELPLSVFVETGTFEGDTIDSVCELFEHIESVELSQQYYEKAVDRFRERPHIHLHHGESQQILGGIVKETVASSALYFLDAHWCVADATAGEMSQCPLLDELQAIGSLNDQSVIVIDDARLFLAPPLAPHEISQWPSFDDVLRCLRELNGSHQVMVFNDTILFFPPSVEQAVVGYAQHHGTDWLDVMHITRDYDNLREQFVGLQQQLQEKEAYIQQNQPSGLWALFRRLFG